MTQQFFDPQRNSLNRPVASDAGDLRMSRRSFLAGSAILGALAFSGALSGCSSPTGSATGLAATGDGATGDGAADAGEPIVMVWLPDNSSADLSGAREVIAAAITKACGRPAEMLTTVDYNVTIEAIATGKAQIAYLGSEGYVQANRKNPAVQAAFTESDEEGGLDGACYYSRIAVLAENADQYRSGATYSIDNIRGASFSFVSATSTSGFAVPSATIVEKFGLESSDGLLESGSFFSEVLFGNSHQGSAVNLLSGDADAAAFDDVDVDMYFDLVEGEANTVGARYRVRDDAGDPFEAVHGKEFVIIGIAPVLNAPICFNEEALPAADREKIVAYFCSDEVANDPAIFMDPEDENAKGIWEKESPEKCFVEVDDAWYDPIRELGGAA